jgi:RimJ/RimL family protein N-acetyltransferase
MKQLLKALTRLLFGEYAFYYIYTHSAKDFSRQEATASSTFRVIPVNASLVLKSDDPLIQQQVGYAGLGAHGYACLDFWPLLEREAKLVQIISLPEMRGRGIASLLIGWSCQDMLEQGFDRVYARIWHSNTPSIKAFERAGWSRVSLVIEINPLRRAQPTKLRINSKFLIRSS